MSEIQYSYTISKDGKYISRYREGVDGSEFFSLEKLPHLGWREDTEGKLFFLALGDRDIPESEALAPTSRRCSKTART